MHQQVITRGKHLSGRCLSLRSFNSLFPGGRYFHNDICDQGNLQMLGTLLAKTSNVNLKDDDGISPLLLAIRNKNTDAVNKFLSTIPDMLCQENDILQAFNMCLTHG